MGESNKLETLDSKKNSLSDSVFDGTVSIACIAILSATLSKPSLPILFSLFVISLIAFNAYELMKSFCEIIEVIIGQKK